MPAVRRSIPFCCVLLLIVVLPLSEGALRTARGNLSRIIGSLASAGYQSITEVSFEEGAWAVEAQQDGQPVGLRVDPESGKVLKSSAAEPHPPMPADCLSAQVILEVLEESGYRIKRIEFVEGRWRAQARKNGGWRELILDLPQPPALSRHADPPTPLKPIDERP